MKQSRITLALSLAALLAGGIALPGSASAHERDSDYRQGRDHHDYRQVQPRQQRYQRADSWYLMRHREVHPHGHRAQPHLYRMHGQRHQHKPRAHYYYQPQPRYEQRSYSPVRLEIGYEIVL